MTYDEWKTTDRVAEREARRRAWEAEYTHYEMSCCGRWIDDGDALPVDATGAPLPLACTLCGGGPARVLQIVEDLIDERPEASDD